ncbi:phosphoribosylaminoimidazole carboxylase, PurK protein [Synechococcus sp. PCC 7502]|uniref:5-(carboxyamino)imidazole ribonucleotide synthase n=1 Tax=Synechococcus sp. PCC 7502 TaxID=1173263 RepID=UPI00029F9E63|nr:5-(carboxyamino)imidazole ribonucleotide synthase [Synechococcus sp. PCC 7502]AFY73001.1 phosphoribosylaminoimidazole carboxylase, PurK protein [Synechococcus sp. PCC 7502]
MTIKVGIIGGGQLAAMMAIASKPQELDISIAVQAQGLDDPAVTWAEKIILGKVDDAKATAELAQYVDVITFENEFVDLEKLQVLADAGTKFIPSLQTLEPLLDKYTQRSYLQEHGIPVPKFSAITTAADLSTQPISFPLVLKARRNGYDGQGTRIVNSEAELRDAWHSMGKVPALVEEKVDFVVELAVMIARSSTGECLTYPVVETHQLNQVCTHVIAPARINQAIATQAQEIAKAIVTNLDAVGIFGIEYFLTADGKVSVNEIAPRTHNSGHYTIEACHTSQFEQLLRIVTYNSLGDISMRSPVAVMVNLLGYENVESEYVDIRHQLEKLPNCSVHWYGKNISRIGRKLGHVTVLMENYENIEQTISTINAIWQP